jgi:5,5'-dehydrodivanillate O-demethylase oxygenase subunit
MLDAADNKLLTEVGPGTPGGELLRHYWHPVCGADELARSPLRTHAFRLLGEDLVLYRDRSGRLGVVQKACPHRRASLAYGVVEADGIRCQYHGWKFDAEGTCVEQPYEDTVLPDGKFRERCSIQSYRAEELGGLVFVYLGADPAPLVPRWGPLVWDQTVRDIVITTIPCNWVQAQENSLDSTHTEHLHDYAGNYFGQVLAGQEPTFERARRHLKLAYEPFEHGIIKRRVTDDRGEDHPRWTIGHTALFPNILWNNAIMQWRVPIDDTSLLHVTLYVYRAAPGREAPTQDEVPTRRTKVVDEDGTFAGIDLLFHQDYLCWASQGPIADREHENLGRSDRGVLTFRKQLREQIDLVQSGAEPTINVFRDPADNDGLEHPRIPNERVDRVGAPVLGQDCERDANGVLRLLPFEAGTSRDVDKIEATMATWDEGDLAAATAISSIRRLDSPS